MYTYIYIICIYIHTLLYIGRRSAFAHCGNANKGSPKLTWIMYARSGALHVNMLNFRYKIQHTANVSVVNHFYFGSFFCCIPLSHLTDADRSLQTLSLGHAWGGGRDRERESQRVRESERERGSESQRVRESERERESQTERERQTERGSQTERERESQIKIRKVAGQRMLFHNTNFGNSPNVALTAASCESNM